MRDLTVVYYTANTESPRFEARVRNTLWRTIKRMRLPLISVSQEPIDFGQNICVGRVGTSSQNAFRQFQVGAKAAKTRFVCPTEADIIYPPEYFRFRPERDDTFYVAHPLWVAFAQRGRGKTFCHKPHGSEAAMVVNRELFIRRVDEITDGRGEWGMLDADGKRLPYLLSRRAVKTETFTLPTPIVTFKTDRNMHRKTPHDVESRCRDLPGIGNIYDLLRRYHG